MNNNNQTKCVDEGPASLLSSPCLETSNLAKTTKITPPATLGTASCFISPSPHSFSVNKTQILTDSLSKRRLLSNLIEDSDSPSENELTDFEEEDISVVFDESQNYQEQMIFDKVMTNKFSIMYATHKILY